jgi:hypothetical protein
LNLGIALYNYCTIIEKLRETYLAYARQFPKPILVPGRKTSKKPGEDGVPITKHDLGVASSENKIPQAKVYYDKIGIFFEKYHLAVALTKLIFADVVPGDFEYFTLCNSLFRSCSTDKGLITKLNDVLRVFYSGTYCTSQDAYDAKKRWLEDPASFASQIKLKLGKPGVLPIGLYKETVSTDFSVLLDDIDKRSSDDLTNNNGVLIRYQILRFY